MTSNALSYAVVTPARDEAADLPRLAECLGGQTVRPRAWLIVDTGSEDDTVDVANGFAADLPGTSVLAAPLGSRRGEAVVVRAFSYGVSSLRETVDVIVKLDADVSFAGDYFERLLQRFVDDPQLGIASGTCLEQQDGVWSERHVTGDHVWGACRVYRASCFADVCPLEERTGWDGLDAFQAYVKGWHTATFRDIPFRHHRPEGRRHGRWDGWRSRGHAAHYMGYRPTFIVLRALHHARQDPYALALVQGWTVAAIRREPRCRDSAAREVLRRQQRLRELPARRREAEGRRAPSPAL
jgi:glycosyltransferase involved in cell wall biosynthesis